MGLKTLMSDSLKAWLPCEHGNIDCIEPLGFVVAAQRHVTCPGGREVLLVPTETTHATPPKGSGTMPCCGRTPFEVSRTDRMTLDPELVTCGVAVGDTWTIEEKDE